MGFVPPIPIPISGGGSGGGSSISDNGARVAVVTDSSNLSSLAFDTNNASAMTIDSNQNVIIGTSQLPPTSRLSIIDSMGKCITMQNSLSQVSANIQIDSNGLSLLSSNNIVNLNTNSVYIRDNCLYLGNVQVTSTAGQLNYNAVAPGSASPSKTLVLDSNKSIFGITQISANILGGTLTTAYQPNIEILEDININHTLSIAGTNVRSSADELNYLFGVIAGTITQNKAFVFDNTKNLIGVNRLSATTIAGTLETSEQLAITSVGTLTNLNTSGKIGIGTITPATELEIVSSTPTIQLNNSTTTASIALVSNNLYLSSNNSIVLGGSVSLANNTLSNVSTLTATTINGTIATANQPNITSIGTLTSIDISEDAVIGTFSNTSLSHRLIINEPNGALLQMNRSAILSCLFEITTLGDLLIAPTRNVNIVSSLSISGSLTGITNLTANSLSGTLQTANQPNITTIGTLGSLSVTNTISANSITCNTITGVLQTASQPNITTVGTLTSLEVTNDISSASVTTTTISGVLQTSNQDNITRTGTLTRLLSTAPLGIGITSPTSVIDIDTSLLSTALAISMTDGTNSSSIVTNNNGLTISASGSYVTLGLNNSLKFNGGGIIGLDSLSVNTLSGTLQTASQPNITTIGTLDSLTVTHGITSESLSATTLSGTLQTTAQPNITSVGTLNSLNVTNGVTALSIGANTISGTLQTAIQDNITRTGILTRLLTTASLGIGVSTPNSVIDINTSSITTALQISMTDGTNSSVISTDSDGILLNTSGQYISLGSGKSLRLNNGGIIGLSSLSVTTISGTLQTASQPNITTVGTLNYVDTTYIGLGDVHLSTYRINVLDTNGTFAQFSNGSNAMFISILNNDYTINTSTKRLALDTNVDLVINGGTILGLGDLQVTTLYGTIATPNQSQITTVGTLSALDVSGDTTLVKLTTTDQITAPSVYVNGGPLTVVGAGSISTTLFIGTSFTLGTTTMTQTALDDLIEAAYAPTLQGGTAGIVEANLALVPDSNKDMGTFNNLRALNLYGSIQNSYQPLITTIGTLGSLYVTGEVGIGTNTPNQKMEIVSVTGNCLRLSNSTASTHADITVDNSGNIVFTSNSTKMDSVMIGNTTNTQIPMEIGYTAFTVTDPYSYRMNTGGMGVINPNTNPTSYNYSLRALGRILCTGSIDVMSDKRVKKNIKPLTDDYCTSFIKCTTPVRYNRTHGDPNECFGYIAQELMRAGFTELVNLIPDESMIEEIDEDGYISPAGIAYNISYEHIIPILAKNQQRLMKENEELRDKIDQIMSMLGKS